MSVNEANTAYFDGCEAMFNTVFEANGQNGGSVSPEYIQSIVKDYIEQNAIPAGRTTYVTLKADAWVEETEKMFSQVVDVDGVTENSDLTIKISAEQLKMLHPKDLSFVACNENGIVTFYAVGTKPPQNDYVVEITVAEVSR